MNVDEGAQAVTPETGGSGGTLIMTGDEGDDGEQPVGSSGGGAPDGLRHRSRSKTRLRSTFGREDAACSTLPRPGGGVLSSAGFGI